MEKMEIIRFTKQQSTVQDKLFLQKLFVTCPVAHFGFTWAESGNFFNAFKDFLALSLRTRHRGEKAWSLFSISLKCRSVTIECTTLDSYLSNSRNMQWTDKY